MYKVNNCVVLVSIYIVNFEHISQLFKAFLWLTLTIKSLELKLMKLLKQ